MSASPKQPVEFSGIQSVQPLQSVQTIKHNDFEPASNNKRVVAFLIDAVFAAIAQNIFLAVLPLSSMTGQLYAGWIAVPIFGFAYWAYPTHRWGGTPGKMIMGLRVVNADHTPNVSLGRLFFRETIGRAVSGLPLALGYLWVAWDKDRRTWHDMMAKTRVIDFKK